LLPFSIQRRLVRKTEKDFLPGPVVTQQRAMALNWKEGRLRLDRRKKFFAMGYNVSDDTLGQVVQRIFGCLITERV